MCVMFLQWLWLVCPSYVSVLASSGLSAWTCSCESVRFRLRVRQTLTVLKLYSKFTSTIRKYFLRFLSFFRIFCLRHPKAKIVTTSTLANLAANLDWSCSIGTVIRHYMLFRISEVIFSVSVPGQSSFIFAHAVRLQRSSYGRNVFCNDGGRKCLKVTRGIVFKDRLCRYSSTNRNDRVIT